MQTSQPSVTPVKPVKKRFILSSTVMLLGSLISIIGIFYPWNTLTTKICGFFICNSQSQTLTLVQIASMANALSNLQDPGTNQPTSIEGLDVVQNLAGQAGALIALLVILGLMLLLYRIVRIGTGSQGQKLGGGGNILRVLCLLLALYLLFQIGSIAFNPSLSLNLWQLSTYFSSGVAMTYGGLLIVFCGFALELFSL